MTIKEALSTALGALEKCHIPMKDAGAAGEAMRLISSCITALTASQEQEEAK